ncbi:hypothetical protein Tco_0586365 [Tanacetum coccineum]
MDTAYRTSWIRRIGPPRYGVSDLLGTAYWATPVRCIGVLGYGVLGYSGTVFCTSWVRRIELLGYGVLAESVLFLIFDQSIIYDVYTDVDTAYSSKSGNDLLIRQNDDEPQNEDPNEGERETTEGPVVEYFDTIPTKDDLTDHKYLMCGPIPSIFLRNPIIIEGCPSNLKIPCNIGHVHVEKSYIDLNSPLNIMTRMMYNWIMRRKLNPRENSNGGISNFTGRIKGMHIFVENFTYMVDFMIVEDISSIINLRLSQVVQGRPFIEISNMTHDLPEGVVRFTNENDEIAYKMPHKIEQYNSLSNLEKEHTKLS